MSWRVVDQCAFHFFIYFFFINRSETVCSGLTDAFSLTDFQSEAQQPAGNTELMVKWVLRCTDLSESFCCMCEEDLV